VQPVALAPARAGLSVSGTVQARVQADLAFRVGGKVTARPVEIGDHVRAGQELARLDPADLQFSQELAEAALQSAQADAAQAQADLRRYDALGRSSPAFLPSEYDKRLAAQRMANARVVQAQRQLSLARDQRAYGVLTADADGIITALPIQVGQVVTAGQTTATVAHTAEIEIVADVPENRLPGIRAAGDVDIRLWAQPGIVLHGHVREVGALADPASRTFAVKVTVLDAPPDVLALGMTASVSIGIAGPMVAALPATALTDQGGKPAVWVLDATTHRATLRGVEVAGYDGDGSVLVRAGLAAGEQVVTAGVQQIEPGMVLTAWTGAAR
jgi:RND family efflux transporter MFP subunit